MGLEKSSARKNKIKWMENLDSGTLNGCLLILCRFHESDFLCTSDFCMIEISSSFYLRNKNTASGQFTSLAINLLLKFLDMGNILFQKAFIADINDHLPELQS